MDHIYIFLLTLIFTLFPDPVRKEWEFCLMNSRVAKVLVGIFVCCPLALAEHVSGHCEWVLLTIISSSAVEHPACMQISRGRLHATFGCLERGCIASFGDHCGMFSQSGPLERFDGKGGCRWLTLIICLGGNGVDESVTTENFLFGKGHGSCMELR